MNKEIDDYFLHLSELEYWYFLLRQLAKPQKPRSPLDTMIDQATGYADARSKARFNEAVEIYENIIRLKKLLNYNDWKDMQVRLDELKAQFGKAFEAQTK